MMLRFGQPFRFLLRENLGAGVFDLMAGRTLDDGRLEAITAVTVATFPPGSAHPGNSVGLTVGEAQQLLDELWRAGLRPSDASDHGTTGHLKALEKHAEIMEAIACGLLRRDGVEL